jgi:Skp family chaperone for outer membrane proteins
MSALVRVLVGLLIAVPGSALAQPPAVQDQPQARLTVMRLGSFSPQRAFSQSAEGKAGLARLTALQEKRGREIAEKNKALQAQEQALQASLSVMTDEARNQKTKDLEKFRVDVQRFIQDAQAEVTGAQRDMESGFLARLKPALERVVKDQGLQLIVNLDESAVVWADPVLDITAEVVKQLARADIPRHP